jgi:hypothetical protein
MARQELASPFQSFLAGRQARQQEDYARTRNSLAEMELADAPAQMQRRNALANVQLEGAQVGLQSAQQQLSADQAKFAYAKLKQAEDSGNPKAFIMQQIPDLAAKLQEQGIDLNSMDDDSVLQLTNNLARKYAGEAGIAPTARLETLQTDGGGILQRDPTTGELKQVVAAQKPETGFTLGAGETRFGPDGKPMASVAPKPATAGQFRALTPQEIASVGLPAGTSAQVDQATGKIDVLSKRDTTATLSQKDANTAKLKLNTIKIARNQLNKILEAYKAGTSGAGPNAFGGAQGWMPTQAGKRFDAAVDQMRSTLTALTRVPGVGAMSDYETKLDQAKFPSRTDYESVTAEKIRGIEDMLAAIETGYTDLLSGGASQPASAAPTAPQASGEMRVNSVEEAMSLPPGTVFITPDGRRKVR